MSFERSSDFDQSPAKMFGGLFVLIVILACGFLLVRWLSPPTEGTNGGGPENSQNSSAVSDSPEGYITNPDDVLGGPGINQDDILVNPQLNNQNSTSSGSN